MHPQGVPALCLHTALTARALLLLSPPTCRNSQVELKLRPLIRNKELHDTYLRQGERERSCQHAPCAATSYMLHQQRKHVTRLQS
jgi:hypothetical protein